MQISVDGDTSTNDTVIGLASGAAGNALISDPASPEAKQLEDAVTALLQACAATCLFSHSAIAIAFGSVQEDFSKSEEGLRDPNFGVDLAIVMEDMLGLVRGYHQR